MGCTDGPAMLAAAEKVVGAARAVTALEREVAQSAAPVEISGWQVAGGCKRKMVQVVSQLARCGSAGDGFLYFRHFP